MKVEQNGPKQWTVIHKDESIVLFLLASSITNKFFIVSKYIENVSKVCGEEFDTWFFNLLKDCQDQEKRPQAIMDNLDKLQEFSDAYITSLNMDYSQFVDESKAKKNSILFSPIEIEKIIRLSCYLKLYSVISNTESLRLGQKLHREVYNKMAIEAVESEIIRKVYDVIKTKTYRYNMTDKFMWEYIKNVQGKDIGAHIIEIFNFIMNNILVLCEENKNPIAYFVGVIDESVRWFLRSVYKDSIVYDDSIATEDIQGINTDNLKTYSYNDTLGRLKNIAYEKIYQVLENQNLMKIENSGTDEHIVQFHARISEISFVSPLCECTVFPVLSEITSIPYYHFKTLSPEHAAVISIYVQDLLRRTFPNEYKETFTLLSYFPLKSPSISTTYTIKSVHDYIDMQDQKQNFYGFNTKILPHRMLCHFVGRIARVSLCNIIDGKELPGIPLSKVEKEMINFYTLYFAGEFKKDFEKMTQLMDADF